MEVPHVHKVMQQPNLLSALLSNYRTWRPLETETNTGAPDLEDGDPNGDPLTAQDNGDQALWAHPREMGSGCNFNPYSPFRYSYTGDGRVKPTVKIKNDELTAPLDVSMHDWSNRHVFPPINDECNLILPL